MSESLRRTWPQRLTFIFVLVAAFVCFLSAGALAVGQWVLSSRALVVVADSAEQFEPEAASTDVVMPGDTTTTAVPTAPGETTTTTTIHLAEPDAANFLLTGADNGACIDQDDPTIGDRGSLGERSDTIMVWRVNPVTNQLAVLSFPRDLYVDLPGGRKGRINEAYRRNDPSGLVDTLQRNFGVPVDHYVQIDFCAFKRLVDAVGGVEVPFEYPAQDKKSGLVVTDTGCVNLEGDMALAYVRSRYYQYEDPPGSGEWHSDGTSDFGRIARQQDFLRRVVAKVIGDRLYSPNVASALITTNREYLVTDAELTPRRMLEFASTLRNLDPASITTYRIESTSESTASGQSVQRPRIGGDNMEAILAVFRGEATLASAPEQVVSTSTTLALPGTTTSTSTTILVDDDAGDDGDSEATAPTTTLPTVEATENVLGVTPPRDVACN
jgi:LCP family protein required for cell wall assembly